MSEKNLTEEATAKRSSALRKGRIISAVLSVLLSVGIWFGVNLSLTYKEYVSVPVRVHCNGLDGFCEASSNAPRIGARCSNRGYQLVRLKRRSREGALDVDVRPEHIHYKGGNRWYMTSRDLADYVPEIFMEGSSVDMFSFDTIYFTFASELYKKVPVELFLNIQCDPQYTIVYPVRVTPDSMTVYGAPAHLDKLESLTTAPIRSYNTRASLHGVARIPANPNFRFGSDDVTYDIEICRFTEVTKVLPLTVRGVPSSRDCIALPSSVELTLRCRFPLESDPLDGVECYVDYSDFVQSREGYTPVHVSGLGDWVISSEVDPPVVEILSLIKN